MQDDLPGAQPEEDQDSQDGPKVNHVEREDDQVNDEEMLDEEQELADPDNVSENYEVDQNGVNENAEEVEDEVDQMDQNQEGEEEEEDVQGDDFLEPPVRGQGNMPLYPALQDDPADDAGNDEEEDDEEVSDEGVEQDQDQDQE